MDLTADEQKTLEYYEQNALTWVKGRQHDDFWAPEADVFKKLLPKGKILEIGCGVGYEAAELTKRGYDYVGTDIAATFVAEAKRRYPNLEFIQSSAYELPFADGSFDGFWTVATLLHIPKDKLPTALGEIRRALRSGSFGFIAVKEGDDQEVDKRGRFFSYYQGDELAAVLEQNGFEVVKTARREHEPNIWLEFWVRLEP